MGTRYVLDVRESGLLLAEAGATTSIAVAESESTAVRRAVDDLARDLERVCGGNVAVTLDRMGARIVVGTIGVSPSIDAAIAVGRLDVSGLRETNGHLRWEGFQLAVVDDTLYIAGTDRRGTMYGVYDLCESIGVSPWWWWADVPVRRREHITVARDLQVQDWPGVAYRGIFLNDEEELDAWARAHTPDGTIGPATYERVFELLLRLKGNYLWPAMHVGAFNADPDNGRLAEEMGIVVGTSHCDMLLRSNEHEFRPWTAASGEHVDYDYSIPGRNRELLREYWAGSVAQNQRYEVSWTVGMRGIHDYGFRTSVIDANEHLSETQKHRERVALLEEVIADQRQLMREHLGERASDSLQIFIPYKEVLPLYDSGLQVPEDVMIVWADDSFGYVRRFPSPAELTRTGGHGLYYHSSYWSQPPRSYLATSSTPLALMRNELHKAWERGIRRLWVDNVGGLKPLELETEFFLRCGWEAGKETSTDDVIGFVEQWFDETFSGGHGKRVAALYAGYYQLNNQRKLEHLASGTFAQSGYGDEAATRLYGLHRLYQEANDILEALPADERDAFFQLVLVKVHLAYLVNGEFLHADRSILAYAEGKPAAADRHLEISRTFGAHARTLIHSYNHVVAGGRWEHIFTPNQFPPPVMALHPAARPALRTAPSGLNLLTSVTPAAESTGTEIRVDLHVSPEFAGWVEADGYVSIDPALPDRSQGGASSNWRPVPLLGRYGNGLLEARREGAVPSSIGHDDAVVEYDVHLATPGAHLLEVHRLPTLDATGSIRLGVSIDDCPPVVVESPTTDEYRGNWTTVVLDNVERLRVRLPYLEPGPHTLRLHVVDRYVGVSKLVVYTGGRRESNLGPAFSYHTSQPSPLQHSPVDNVDLRELDEVARTVYKVDPAGVPLPPVVYAGPGFWDSDTTFKPNLAVPQRALGAPRRWTRDDGSKDVVGLLGSGAVIETDGVIAFEIENALIEDATAWTTPSTSPVVAWTHTQAETDGGSGLAMHVADRGLRWDDPVEAPGLHYALQVSHPGLYHVWLLVKFDSRDDDACLLSVDGAAQSAEQQFSGGDLYSFGTQQIWLWTLLSDIELTAGRHVLSILARKSGLRIDRAYLTTTNELPPADAEWTPSSRGQ